MVATPGGSWADFLKSKTVPPFQKANPDVNTTFAAVDDPVIASKLVFEKNAPKGSYSFVESNLEYTAKEQSEGTLEKIDYSRIPEAKHILPQLRSTYQVPTVWAPFVIIYNKNKIKTPPKSWGDLWNPAYKGKIGLLGATDHAEEWMFAAAAMKAHKYPGNKDWDIPYNSLKQLASNAKVYSQQDDLGQALLTGEVDIAINTLGRAIPWEHSKGQPLAHVIPEEGTMTFMTSGVIPKNTTNEAASYAYLRTLLTPQVQGKVATDFGYLPTTDNAQIPSSRKADFALSSSQKRQVHIIDGQYLLRVQDQWSKFWTREVIQGG